MESRQFISIVSAFKRSRSGSRGFSAFREHDYLRVIQSFISAKFQCSCWFGGSLALYLQGQRETYGDVDVITDRMFSPDELPWNVEDSQGFNWKSEELQLDLFFRRDERHEKIIELSKASVIEVDELRVANAEFVENISWCWSQNQQDGDKLRQCRIPNDEQLLVLRSALLL